MNTIQKSKLKSNNIKNKRHQAFEFFKLQTLDVSDVLRMQSTVNFNPTLCFCVQECKFLSEAHYVEPEGTTVVGTT